MPAFRDNPLTRTLRSFRLCSLLNWLCCFSAMPSHELALQILVFVLTCWSGDVHAFPRCVKNAFHVRSAQLQAGIDYGLGGWTDETELDEEFSKNENIIGF
ncbi:exported hypothetical protein [Paraburkholderia piptadeniae]|uniref:Uncharacterized protein n=1 Tax=Paraburkholderia piptadeniae TaxID=1701573 RepID=A0A1N7RV73_9BURK|nr:exported hypothetical protein [Paraburkholderia piptadeniae]